MLIALMIMVPIRGKLVRESEDRWFCKIMRLEQEDRIQAVGFIKKEQHPGIDSQHLLSVEAKLDRSVMGKLELSYITSTLVVEVPTGIRLAHTFNLCFVHEAPVVPKILQRRIFN
jgi:hypothetical protein